jgi:hypothetical protein
MPRQPSVGLLACRRAIRVHQFRGHAVLRDSIANQAGDFILRNPDFMVPLTEMCRAAAIIHADYAINRYGPIGDVNTGERFPPDETTPDMYSEFIEMIAQPNADNCVNKAAAYRSILERMQEYDVTLGEFKQEYEEEFEEICADYGVTIAYDW